MRPIYRPLSSIAILAFLAGCSQTDSAGASNTQSSKGGGDASLQTTLAAPAPEGQTALKVDTLATGLSNPWSIAFLPDNLILVTERSGTVRAVRNGELQDEPIAGAPDVYVNNQGGMFDIMPHPEFASNGVIFLAYAYGTNDANALRVARANFDGKTITDLTPIYDATPLKDTGHHFGGRLVWGGDDKLYISIGEGSRYKEKAQDNSSSFGAIVRINPDGSIPDDNPEFGDGALPEIYSKGHRNPQGLVYDAKRDVLWENEHGPRGGDEINIVQAGANYGWPIASYGIDYNGAKITPFTEYEGTIQPFKYWTPSIAPSGMAVYYGDMFPDWSGDLLVGAMSSSSGEALHRIIMDDMSEVGEERYLLGNRIRDVRVGPDGAIYVTTEERRGAPEGTLLRITPQ